MHSFWLLPNDTWWAMQAVSSPCGRIRCVRCSVSTTSAIKQNGLNAQPKPTVLLKQIHCIMTSLSTVVILTNGLAGYLCFQDGCVAPPFVRCNPRLYGNGTQIKILAEWLRDRGHAKDHPDLLIMADPVIAILIAEIYANRIPLEAYRQYFAFAAGAGVELPPTIF